MHKLLIFVGATIGGIAFGYAADALGADMMVSFLVSSAGTVLGIFAGYKAAEAIG